MTPLRLSFVALAALVAVSTARPAPVSAPVEVGDSSGLSPAITVVGLRKHGEPITNDDGTANFETLQRHLTSARSKYQSTIAAFLANTGRVLGDVVNDSPDAPDTGNNQEPCDPTSRSTSRTSATNGTSCTAYPGSGTNSTSLGSAYGTNSTSPPDTGSTPSTNSTSPQTPAGRTRRKRQSEPLTDYNNDLLWAGTVGVGTPPQAFTIMFDTGSSDFFVPSVQCLSSGCQGNQYDASLSTTAKKQRGSFSTTYADGTSSSGPIYTETVTVGSVVGTREYFSPVTQMSDGFASEPEDGIFGMAYPTISNMKGRAGSIFSNDVFSFRIQKPAGGPSELYLGGVNPARYSGKIEWHDNNKEAYYNISGVPLLNNKLVFPKTKYNIIDSGTTVIIAPPQDADTFWSQVPGASRLPGNDNGYYTYPCATPPTLSFVFGTNSTRIRPRPWKVSSQDLNLGRLSAGSTTCVGAVTGMDVGLGSDTWILGDSFLKNVYSVFDMANDVVGFATPV